MKKLSISYKDSITLEELLFVWKEFVRGKRGRCDVVDFSMRLMSNLIKLQHELAEGTYRHSGYTSFGISDPKPRLINKASVRDRVVHHLLYRMLYGYFDKRFIYDSYSCRINKGTHRALARFTYMARTVSRNHTKTAWVLKCDVKKFFASIDHLVLKNVLRAHINSPEVLWLLDEVIDSFCTEGRPGVGLPLGNLTSQLLVNIYMNEFDQFVKHVLGAKYYIRYADDFVVLSCDRVVLESLLSEVHGFFRNRLKLKLHPDKVSIATLASGIDFLGWVHFPDHRVLRTATKRRMLKAVSENPSEEIVESYRGLLGYGNTYGLRVQLGAIMGALG